MIKLALLGDPVDHSLSPRLHTAALQATGIDGEYVARRVDESGMREAVTVMRGGDLHGANVTMPHKHLAAALADSLGPDAQRAGSANTLVQREGRVIAVTTDVEGIRRAWGSLGTGPVLILGAGGAAAAALLALEPRPLSVSARRSSQVRELLDRTGVNARVVEWGAGVEGCVVVNATPLGMTGEGLPESVLDGSAGLFDMAYGSGQTPATERALSLGLPVVESLEMLIAQAALSFELWTGVPAPIEAMRAAVGDDHSAGSNL